ncbi:hypothetical protein [Nitrosopumilus sp. b2]|uniref:hypothetical protein n=1 Tax=Nitrosopumilus sp. b2 TaxID=2109908 RepID=UPI0015F66045|nr:hypothetical protein [Nitrosopumilus sp. b2]KAF6244456.1 hypothetical protein C6989_09305 [Nitrosopumilus sp. b2]
MFDQIIKNFVSIKQDFAKNYSGNAHIQEVIPASTSDQFPLEESHLEHIHKFAEKNPIYFNSFEEKILGIDCVVYEGDINDYWLNSIKHGTSCQPFYPTWIFSAYLMVLIAKKLGYQELIDIGSGDGRIAFCGKFLGFTSHSIEIDDGLVELQKLICNDIEQNFDPVCDDALEFDYSKFQLKSPVFFIGGLPQMGGDMLATSIIDKINSIDNLKKSTGIVFAGTHSKRQLSGNLSDGGWSSLIQNHNLQVIKTVSLPTVWTFDQTSETPYIYTKFN